MSKNKLDNLKKALTEIVRREQERVNKQQSIGKFPIEASVLIIAKEALVDLECVMDGFKSEELVDELDLQFYSMFCTEHGNDRDFKESFCKELVQEAINTITGETK